MVFVMSGEARTGLLSNTRPISPTKQRHKETGVARVHETLKLFGKGIKVGVIDSGIDYKVTVSHALLSDVESTLWS